MNTAKIEIPEYTNNGSAIKILIRYYSINRLGLKGISDEYMFYDLKTGNFISFE